MRNFRGHAWALAAALFALRGAAAFGQDASEGSHVVQVSFGHLVPIAFPVHQTRFDRLRSTIYPLVDTAGPVVPITTNVIDPFAQPLLRPNGYGAASGVLYGSKVVSASAAKRPVGLPGGASIRVDRARNLPYYPHP